MKHPSPPTIAARLTAIIPGEPIGMHRPRFTARCPRNVALCASKQCRPFVQAYPLDSDKEYRARAVAALKAAYAGAPLEGPLAISVRVILPRPKSSREPGRFWHSLQTRDADNFLKAVQDAGTDAHWWVDDGQIARVVVEKVVGGPADEPRVHVLVQTLEPFGSEDA